MYRKRVFFLPIQICKNEVHDVRELCKIKKKLIKKHFFSKILQNFHPVFTEQKKTIILPVKILVFYNKNHPKIHIQLYFFTKKST